MEPHGRATVGLPEIDDAPEVRAEPHGRATVGLPEIDDAPEVRAKPHGRAAVGLVLADQDRVGYWQQTDQRPVLQELEDLTLVRQASRQSEKESQITRLRLKSS